MFVTTISEVKAFWACPQRWYWQFVAPRRSPRHEAAALVVGTAWHKFMEARLNGSSVEAALGEIETVMTAGINEAIGVGRLKQAKELETEWEKLQVAGPLWKDWLEAETLAVEKPLSLTFNDLGIRINGKPDRKIRLRSNGRMGSMQHKTLGASKPVDPYLLTFVRSPHECTYWSMLEEEDREEPFGVVVNILRKLSIKTIKEAPEIAMQQHIIPISREQACRGVRNVLSTCQMMKRWAENGPQLEVTMAESRFGWFGEMWNNPDRDLGQFGNSADPYLEALTTGDESLLMDDSKFKDTEVRYETVEGEV